MVTARKASRMTYIIVPFALVLALISCNVACCHAQLRGNHIVQRLMNNDHRYNDFNDQNAAIRHHHQEAKRHLRHSTRRHRERERLNKLLLEIFEEEEDQEEPMQSNDDV